MPRFRRFQGRLLFFFLGLFILVQAAALVLVDVVITENARKQISGELLVGGRVFDRLVVARTERLSEAARILSGDFAFKTAFADGDRPTLVSAMENNAARVGADVMMLVSLDRSLIADTLHPKAPSRRFPFPPLIEAAERSGEASSFEFIGGRLYQLVVVPLLAPEPVAWICMGFTVDDALARDLRQITLLDVTFAEERPDAAPVVLASTLSRGLRQSFISALPAAAWDQNGIALVDMQGKNYVSLSRRPEGRDHAPVTVVLQRSLAGALEPFSHLRNVLIALFLGGLGVTLSGGVLIARSVTKPVRVLAEGARAIEQGDYGRTVAIKQRDEFGRLASAFNSMAGAIAQREERIRYQAYHDGLTGLANRAWLQAHLAEAVAAAEEGGRSLALILMDIDRFKDVNAALGHSTGDVVLRKIGPLLRESAPQGSSIACMGGDEFAVLLPEGADAGAAVQVVQKILGGLETPILVDGNPIQVEASFGIAAYPAHGADAETLIRRADMSLYRAKDSALKYDVYSLELDRDSLLHLTLLGELRRAIEHGELVMYYQPKVDFSSGRVAGAEALLRWIHPQRGMIPPDQIIPLLEGTGMIRPLTFWTIRTAIGHCAELRRAGMDLTIAVNLSARLLRDQQLPDQVMALIDSAGVPTNSITLEVTESAVMAGPERSLDTLKRLDAAGVRLCIDDFGTGYSSLSYLQNLPVTELKIDKSFVLHMDTDINNTTIVHAIISLAHNLGMKVTAEGVESRRVWDLLKSHGCDLAQGYLLSEPIPFEQFLIGAREATWGRGKPS